VSPEHPSGQALLNREALVRRQGTGINAQDLVGRWCLRTVWSRGQASPSALASFGLRASGATLELQQHDAGLRLVNAIRLGSLTLRFSGTAELVGRRPLLQFCFSDLELRWGEHRLWHRVLPMPAGRQRPFFALIASDPQGWLAARGRGGGLALWELV
jgi:hypothetical protein